MSEPPPVSPIVHLPSRWFLAGCFIVAGILALVGRFHPFPPLLVAIEVFATVLSLFLLGSFKYRLDKNVLTYGALLIIGATFWTAWWPVSALRADLATRGLRAVAGFLQTHFLTYAGLEQLIHLDTMLFILGLTYFVAVISQTRLLESVSFSILSKTRGSLLATVGLITALVAFASGILDGVSMIGLLIRILVILLVLAKSTDEEVIFFVIISTMITTICGLWLAYGEPPNLIMKTNLSPALNDGFFLRHCLPIAAASFLVLLFNMRRRLTGRRIDAAAMDVARNLADVRFLHVAGRGALPDLDSEEKDRGALEAVRPARRRAQRWAVVSFVPFLLMLVAHAMKPRLPLFLASVAGFMTAFVGIAGIPKMKALAFKEARHEYAEYLFLFPLFLSIALLTKTGFFDHLARLLHSGIATVGASTTGFIQFTGATFLSAILDNNVVADFASRALHGLPTGLLHLFAMSQIAGYALGGCWTHIGSAQSVVAYAFIRKDIREHFTPVEWIRMATRPILQIFFVATVLIYVEGHLLSLLK